MIEGGYVLLSREITRRLKGLTPCSRELYTYLIQEVNHTDGNRFKRSQAFIQLHNIRRALEWNVGYRVRSYSEDQMRTAMKTLMKHGMITATKTARGIHVSICNYDTLQDPKSYEARSEAHIEADPETGTKPAVTPGLKHKEDKELKNNKYKEKEKIDNSLPDDLHIKSFNYSAKKGKYEQVQSQGRINLSKQVTELVNVAKGWMPFSKESDRPLVSHAIKELGFELAMQVTGYYAQGISNSKYENPINSPKYWWETGIYTHANKMKAPKPAQIKAKKLSKKKCSECHKVIELPYAEMPSICPSCNEGMLLSRVEYASMFPPKTTEPKTEELSKEQQEGMKALKSFANSFGSQR